MREHPVRVQVGTGENSRVFNCFVDLLKTTSLYFKDELSNYYYPPNGANINQTLTLRVPNEKPEDFERYQIWMDKGALWSTSAELKSLVPCDLAKLFAFARRIDARKLRNYCINGLHKKLQLIANLIINNSGLRKNLTPNDFAPWYRTARWVAHNLGGQPEYSALYQFFTDFFAYFILQVLPKLGDSILEFLPGPFLWHIQRAINNALRRHPPCADQLSAAHSATYNKTGSTATPQTVIDLDEDPAAEPPQPASKAETEPPTPAAAARPITPHDTKEGQEPGQPTGAFTDQYVKDQISTIITTSAMLRACAGFEWLKRRKAAKAANDENSSVQEVSQPPRRGRGRPPKATQTKAPTQQQRRGSLSIIVGGDQEDKNAGAFFGVGSLCAYHFHTSAKMAQACEQGFKDRGGGNEVWPLMPIMKN